MKTPPAITPIVTPNLTAPAYQFNEYIASWAENRTGFNRYSAGTDQNALNKTKGGVELLTAKADARMELMARFFGVGVRRLFAKMLKLSIQHQNVPEMVAINGQFVPINPSEFRNQYHVKINVGLGTGSKEQQTQRVMGLLQTLQLGAQFGVVGPENIAEAIRLYVEANEFKNPERFVSPQATGMPPNPQAFQQMQQQVQQQMQGLQQQLQQAQQENMSLKMQAMDKQAQHMEKMARLQLDHAKATDSHAIDAGKLSLEQDKASAQFGLDAAQLDLDAMQAAQQFTDDGTGMDAPYNEGME